ncbi:MAG: tetratricopeptide repeat protein [Nannocystaceae bacterium]|nr:tetratricopeptide repeat protein [Nannocystaceae bacterium]
MSTVDLYATLADLADVPLPPGLISQSLLRDEFAPPVAFMALPLERAKSLHLLAGIELLEDNAEIALSMMNEVLQLREPILPPDHPDLAQAHERLGRAQFVLGQYRQAIASQRRALAMTESAPGSFAAIRVDMYASISNAFRRLGELQPQAQAAAQALTLAEALGDDEAAAEGIWAFAQAEADGHRFDSALRYLNRAVSATAGGEAAPRFRAELLLARAEVLDALGRGEDARRDSQYARGVLETAGDVDNDVYRRASAWSDG